MVKFGKNKFKALNKIAKNQKLTTHTVSNKVLKKKQNAEKKVTFQKEVLLKETVSSGNALVKKVTAKEILVNELSIKDKKKKVTVKEPATKSKLKPVEKQKKRQKTQINDMKLLLNLMKKKK